VATAPVCLAVRTTPARIVVRGSVPGIAVAWPLLVVHPCPYADPWKPGRHHGHVHHLCEAWPAGRQVRIAPCCRQPYVLTIGEAW
jgi:hypothetical protein